MNANVISAFLKLVRTTVASQPLHLALAAEAMGTKADIGKYRRRPAAFFSTGDQACTLTGNIPLEWKDGRLASAFKQLNLWLKRFKVHPSHPSPVFLAFLTQKLVTADPLKHQDHYMVHAALHGSLPHHLSIHMEKIWSKITRSFQNAKWEMELTKEVFSPLLLFPWPNSSACVRYLWNFEKLAQMSYLVAVKGLGGPRWRLLLHGQSQPEMQLMILYCNFWGNGYRDFRANLIHNPSHI